jgi:hypothetical protein
VGVHQTKKLLHGERNDYENEKSSYKMRENIGEKQIK